MAEGSVANKGSFVVAMTADRKKCLHAMIFAGDEIKHWGEGRKADMVAGVPRGKVRWRIVTDSLTHSLTFSPLAFGNS